MANPTPQPTTRRGIGSIEHLRQRVIVDAVTRCWHWQGAMQLGKPRIWGADLDRMDKRVMTGARAVWYLAHGTRLGPLCAYMGCWTADCVCPVHVRRGTHQEVSKAAGRAGLLGHDSSPSNLVKARAAQGIVDTPATVVDEIRRLAGTASGTALAARFGLSKSTANRILAGRSRAGSWA